MNSLASLYMALAQYLLIPAGLIIGVTAVFALFFLLEKFTPAVQVPTMDERFHNFRIFLLCEVLIASIFVLPVIELVQKLREMAGGSLVTIDLAGFANYFDGLAKPVVAGLLALIPILVYDFFFYWWHRWQHSSPWLWEEHKLHHTDGNVNVTTTKRQHFLEIPLTTFFIGLPLGLFFSFSPVSTVLTTVLIRAWQFFIHANLRWPLGWLTLVFCGPQYHRIHHSIEPHHLNKNFAVWFPVWDVIFGTHYVPRRDEFPQTGVVGASANPSWRESLADPFVAWSAMVRNRFQKRLPNAGRR